MIKRKGEKREPLRIKENEKHFDRYPNKNDFGNYHPSGMRKYVIPEQNPCG